MSGALTHSWYSYQPSDSKIFLVDLPGYGFAKAPPKISAMWLG